MFVEYHRCNKYSSVENLFLDLKVVQQAIFRGNSMISSTHFNGRRQVCPLKKCYLGSLLNFIEFRQFFALFVSIIVFRFFNIDRHYEIDSNTISSEGLSRCGFAIGDRSVSYSC